MVREPIASFSGEYCWLSNFYPCPVDLDGEIYPSVEHAYQAAKTVSPKERAWVRDAPTASTAKWRGNRISIRPDWAGVKLPIMDMLLDQKFHHPALKEKLLGTGTADLIEGNYWGDTFWGVCRGVGANNLGRLLMKIRKELA